MYQIVYLPAARHQLEKAVLYIAEELCAPDAALELLEAVDAAVQSLKEMPYRHPIYPALWAVKREIRFFPAKNHNLYYTIDEEKHVVEIWRVLHQRMQQK